MTKRPATWHWFALGEDRPLFAFAGIWRTYKGPLKADGEQYELNVHSIMTTIPNDLVASIHPTRMPVLPPSNRATNFVKLYSKMAHDFGAGHPAERVFAALNDLIRTTGVAALIATHNTEQAARMDRVLRLEDGLLHEMNSASLR